VERDVEVGVRKIATPPTCMGVVGSSRYRKETSRGLSLSAMLDAPPWKS
jgi:hypothetical protein